jgi:hypothetical protein
MLNRINHHLIHKFKIILHQSTIKLNQIIITSYNKMIYNQIITSYTQIRIENNNNNKIILDRINIFFLHQVIIRVKDILLVFKDHNQKTKKIILINIIRIIKYLRFPNHLYQMLNKLLKNI